MRVTQCFVLEALQATKDFLDAHSELLEAVNKSSARRILDEIAARLAEHSVGQFTNACSSTVETLRQRTLRADLRLQMRPIAAVARQQLQDAPELDALRMPPGNLTAAPLVVAARGMADAAKHHAEVLIQNGLEDDFVEQLAAAATELEQAIDKRNVLWRARSGSTARLAAEEARGRTILRVLASTVRPKLGENPMLLARWKAATQVKRARSVVAPAAAPLRVRAASPRTSLPPEVPAALRTPAQDRSVMRHLQSESKARPQCQVGRPVWVVRSGTGYVAKEEGVRLPFTAVTTQAEAIARARAAARRNRSELIVQGRGGRIRMKTSYGPDPRSRHG